MRDLVELKETPSTTAVQIRLMGPDPHEVTAVALRLAEAGVIAIVGSAPNRGMNGLRVYGIVQ